MPNPQQILTDLGVPTPEEHARRQLRETKLKFVQQLLGLTDPTPISALRAVPPETEAARLVASGEGERVLEKGPSAIQQSLARLKELYSATAQQPPFNFLLPDLSSPAGALAAIGGPMGRGVEKAGRPAFEVFNEEEMLDLYSHASSIVKRIYNTLKARIGSSAPLSETSMEMAETSVLSRLAELIQNKPVTDKEKWLKDVNSELARIASEAISAEARAPIATAVSRTENLAEEGLEAAARGAFRAPASAPIGEILPVKAGKEKALAEKVLLYKKPVRRAVVEIGEGVSSSPTDEITQTGKDIWSTVKATLQQENLSDVTPTSILLARGVPRSRLPATPPPSLDPFRGMTREDLERELPNVFTALPKNDPTRNMGARVARELLLEERDPGWIARRLGYRTKEQRDQFYRLLTRIVNRVYEHFGVK